MLFCQALDFRPEALIFWPRWKYLKNDFKFIIPEHSHPRIKEKCKLQCLGNNKDDRLLLKETTCFF